MRTLIRSSAMDQQGSAPPRRLRDAGAHRPGHRTVSEAIAQAEAKDGIRTALRVRQSGVGLTVAGAMLAVRGFLHTAGARQVLRQATLKLLGGRLHVSVRPPAHPMVVTTTGAPNPAVPMHALPVHAPVAPAASGIVSFALVVGLGLILCGPILAVCGYWLLRRRTMAAHANPATAPIFLGSARRPSDEEA